MLLLLFSLFGVHGSSNFGLSIFFTAARANIKPDPEKDKTKFGFPASQANSYTVSDCRSLVKTLVGGVKTVTYGCAVPRVSVLALQAVEDFA